MSDQVETPAFEIVKASEATEALNRAEIDVQIATAHQFKRDIAKFQRTAISLVSQDEDVAAACFYSLPRDGKTIEGESIRLAEIACTAYGNIRHYFTISAIEEKWVVARGFAHDLETNNAAACEVRRRITKRDGSRFSDDMIIVTCNAAGAIAERNAIYKVIPKALLKPVIRAAEQVIKGDLKTLPERRQKAVEWFKERGVPPEALFKYIGVAGIEAIDLDKLVQLAGLRTRVDEEGKDAVSEILAGQAAGNVFETAKKKPEPAPKPAETPATTPKTAPETPKTADSKVIPPAAPNAPTVNPSEPEQEMTEAQAIEAVQAFWKDSTPKKINKVCDGLIATKKGEAFPEVETALQLRELAPQKFETLVNRILALKK